MDVCETMIYDLYHVRVALVGLWLLISLKHGSCALLTLFAVKAFLTKYNPEGETTDAHYETMQH